MEMNEYSYLITLAHLPNWKKSKINSLLYNIKHKQEISFHDFFSIDVSTLQTKFQLSLKEANDILKAKNNLPNNSFLAEELLSQGLELITLDSPKYPQTLKNNLIETNSPPLLYVKGNSELFFKNKTAIVGSRNVSTNGVEFTKLIAKKCAREKKVVVSGYAKGVDRIALETVINNNGYGIVILPQGILTFKSGFKTLYKYIINGQVLVVSTYPPKAGWSIGLAMGRNVYIYGLGEEIYVAESNNTGGTWNGVIQGLNKGREIFVRKAASEEKCANNELIARGATPVDDFGNIVTIYKNKKKKQIQKTLFEI